MNQIKQTIGIVALTTMLFALAILGFMQWRLP